MLTTLSEIVNLNGTLRRDWSIFYNDYPLINEEDDDKKLLSEINLLSTSSSPGAQLEDGSFFLCDFLEFLDEIL